MHSALSLASSEQQSGENKVEKEVAEAKSIRAKQKYTEKTQQQKNC